MVTCYHYARGHCQALCEPYCAHFYADPPVMFTDPIRRVLTDVYGEVHPEAGAVLTAAESHVSKASAQVDEILRSCTEQMVAACGDKAIASEIRALGLTLRNAVHRALETELEPP